MHEAYLEIARRKAGSAAYHANRHFQYWRWRLGPIVEAKRPHGLDKPLVVSLTSYPPRFKVLPLTLKCLLSQSIKPDAVVLWIAHGDRPHLTRDILQLQEQGLTIRFCDDLKSYKKIIPTLEAYPNCHIVTADDDVYYARNWLHELIAAKQRHHEVLAHRVHRIRLGPDHLPLPYSSWGWQTAQKDASPLNFATGIGGVFYPWGVFDPRVLDTSRFMELCPTADDVWLYWMVRLNGGICRSTGHRTQVLSWPVVQSSALSHINIDRLGGNDMQIGRMIEAFGFPNRSRVVGSA